MARTLDERVRRLENILWVVVAVAVAFGVSFAALYKSLSAAKSKAEEIEQLLADQKNHLEKLAKPIVVDIADKHIKDVLAPVAFSATGDKYTSPEKPTLISYIKTHTNEGDGWNDSSAFVSREPGVYYFHVAFTKDTNDGEASDDDVYVNIHLNGRSVVKAWSGERAGYRDSVSRSVVLKLNKGDRVETFTHTPRDPESKGAFVPGYIRDFSFAGFKISEP